MPTISGGITRRVRRRDLPGPRCVPALRRANKGKRLLSRVFMVPLLLQTEAIISKGILRCPDGTRMELMIFLKFAHVRP